MDTPAPQISEPTDPVPSYVEPCWYKVATRDGARAIVERGFRHGRQRRLVVPERNVGIVTDHMLACGFLFLRRIEETGGFMSRTPPSPKEPSDCPDLAPYRKPQPGHIIDGAAYAIEVIGREERDTAWSAALHLGHHLTSYGDVVLWRAGTCLPGPWRISEVRAAEEAAREAERRRFPSWDDWD